MFLRGLYSIFFNLPYFLKTPYPFSKRIRIVFNLFKFLLKIPFSNFFSFKKEKFLGYRVEFFSYRIFFLLFKEIFYKGEYFFSFNKDKGPVILDCGSNVGISVIFFKWIFPESIIYAFEPNKETFDLLKKNILTNGIRDVFLFNVAVSDKNGVVDFFIDKKEQGSLFMSMNAERGVLEKTTSVSSISLSSFVEENSIKSIDLLKMDIEGQEGFVIQDLQGGNVLGMIDKMVVEYHHNTTIVNEAPLGEILKIFEGNNFNYQVSAKNYSLSSREIFQDVLIYTYKESSFYELD